MNLIKQNEAAMGSINRPKKGSILQKEPIRDENDILLIK
jgi:hypothetical protein